MISPPLHPAPVSTACERLHRVMLKPEAELEGFDADRVLADVIAAVPVPRQ